MPDALRRHVTPGVTPQTEQARPDEVKNNAGGYVFKVGDKTRLNRFLTLGTEGGTYYTNEKALTRDNAGVVTRMAEASSPVLLSETLTVSEAGRAPRNQPALFALAAAAGLGDVHYRQGALDILPRIARTGYHLLVWAEYIEMFRGWGPQLVKGVRNWYLCKTPEDLAYQLLKYKQREGWSQKDLIRLSGFKGAGPRVQTAHEAIFNYVMKGEFNAEALPPLIDVAEQAHETRNVGDWMRLIDSNRSLSHEMLPSEALAEADVWRALIAGGNLPLGALLRNLSRLTRLGVLKQMDDGTNVICGMLLNAERIAKARIHPVAVLLALKTYALGHSLQGKSEWVPVPQVMDALDAMFYMAFGNIEPAGKQTAVCLDVSGSMGFQLAGYPFTAREMTAAMAMVTMRTEPSWAVMGFSHQFMPLPISASQRLDDVQRAISDLPFGRTDCALPMVWAQQNNLAVDTFQVHTDNETWYGANGHPHEALKRYRKHAGINAKLQVIAYTPSEFSIADPLDPGQLDVSGLDASVPNLLSAHSRGEI
jgi:60 kDa SS-A/Ro ribonucleoprotein